MQVASFVMRVLCWVSGFWLLALIPESTKGLGDWRTGGWLNLTSCGSRSCQGCRRCPGCRWEASCVCGVVCVGCALQHFTVCGSTFQGFGPRSNKVVIGI